MTPDQDVHVRFILYYFSQYVKEQERRVVMLTGFEPCQVFG